MSLDTSITRSLNNWAEHYKSLVHLCSNDFVYLVILISVVWFAMRIFALHPIKENAKEAFTKFLVKGILIFAIPVGIAIVISEGISRLYVRDRPFVADSHVKLLVPHGADGGMPSHHVAFMMTLVLSVYFYNRQVGWVLALLTVVSGIARIAAGIHYPTDILAGALLGAAIVVLYRWALTRLAGAKTLSLS